MINSNRINNLLSTEANYNQLVKLLEENKCSHSQTFVNGLLKNIKGDFANIGQVKLATDTKYFKRWGEFYLDQLSRSLNQQIKPNFKALGPRFGKDMGLISKGIQGFTPDQINELEREGTLAIVIAGNAVSLTLEDVEITSQDIEGWLVANSNGITVALDITISAELKQEGIARELVNRIQNIRKDSGFEVTDKIRVTLQQNAELQAAVEANEEYIKSETLTESLVFEKEVANGLEIEFDDIKTRIIITK